MSFLRIYLVFQILPQVFLNDLFNKLFIFFLLVKFWLNYCYSSRIFVITKYKLIVGVCILEILKVLRSLNFHFDQVVPCLDTLSITIMRINIYVCCFWFINALLWETLDGREARSHHRCCLLTWAAKHVMGFYRNHSSSSRWNLGWLECIWRPHYLNEGRFILINWLVIWSSSLNLIKLLYFLFTV